MSKVFALDVQNHDIKWMETSSLALSLRIFFQLMRSVKLNMSISMPTMSQNDLRVVLTYGL